jgi:hypothetical protein
MAILATQTPTPSIFTRTHVLLRRTTTAAAGAHRTERQTVTDGRPNVNQGPLQDAGARRRL